LPTPCSTTRFARAALKKMVTSAVKHEAGDIKLLTHRGQASGRTPGPFIWLPGACICKDRKAL
jgi:hypothetical protein